MISFDIKIFDEGYVNEWTRVLFSITNKELLDYIEVEEDSFKVMNVSGIVGTG